ncbi:MAG: hypothetical protein GY697_22845 [Desulfobacterales bacterium]|nr:hypothetical protein [Desulfobacterales bacterium]
MSGPKFENASLADFAAKAAKTPEIRHLLKSLLSGALHGWCQKGIIRPELARQAGRILARQPVKSGAPAGHPDLVDLLQHPEVVAYIRNQLPVLTSRLLELVDLVTASFENADQAQQKALFNQLGDAFDADKTGRILASLAGTLDRLHKNEPTLFADKTIQILKQVLAQLDFGELKRVFANSESDLIALGKKFNDLLFEYPAKLILMLSFIPGISNHLLVYGEDLLIRFNALPADILADLLISFFKETDARTAGQLINNLAEFIHQVHTGSALTGDGGLPQFSVELARKTRTALEAVDTELLFKAANALVDGHEALLTALYDAAGEDPEFPAFALKHRVARTNAKNRLARQKLDLFENLSEAEAAAAISAGLSEWNAYEFAELINAACAAANNLQQQSPDVVKHIVTEFVNTLDLYEIEETATWLSRDLTQTFQPVLQTVLPVVIKDVISCLTTENDANGDEITEMRTRLRQFIMNEDISG